MADNVGSISYDVSLDTANLVRGQREVDSAVSRAAASFNAITVAVKLYAAAMAMVKTAQMADDLRMLAARIDVAAGSAEKGAEAMRALEGIAKRTGTAISANAEVFGRLNQSLLQMGGTQQDTLQITELLGKAIKVSGASAIEAKAAMLQFGQALGSGKLAGDELRSLMENAPYLMRQLADGLGVPIGALKKLGEDGKLTADVVVNAMSKAAAKIDADFQKLPTTLASAADVARDSFGRMVLAIDEASQQSTVLTGITRGVGDAFDAVAAAIRSLNGEQAALNKSGQIQQWADTAFNAVSYVADGVDFLMRGMRQAGTLIGGLAAAAASIGRGDLDGVDTVLASMGKDIVKIGKEPYAGAKARSDRATNAAQRSVEDRGFTPVSATRLKAPAGAGDKKGGKFDALGYLSGLSEKAADEREKITIIEEEALRKAENLRKEGKINAEQYGAARTLIAEAAARSRMEIEDRANKQIEDLARQANEKIAADETKSAEERKRAREAANAILDGADPVTKLRAELEAKSALLTEYAQRDQDNALLYEAAKVQLAKETADKIKAIEDKRVADQTAAQMLLLQGYGGMFGSMADMAKTFGGEQSKTYKALFAVSKAFAIAESLIKIQQGIAAAAALPFPANIPAMATVASMTAGIVANIKGVNFGGGRQYGGPVGAGTMYRVNEGGRPEMFTAANGNQYMMPTADGRVTPSGSIGGASWNIVVNNNAPGAQATASVDEQGRTVTIAIAQVADQIRSNSGPVWSALRSSTNVSPRIS